MMLSSNTQVWHEFELNKECNKLDFIPKCCPVCGTDQICDELASVKRGVKGSDVPSFGAMLLLGLSSIFISLLIGKDKEEVMKVRICEPCLNRVTLFKILGWISIIGGIVLAGLTMYWISQSASYGPQSTKSERIVNIVVLAVIVVGAAILMRVFYFFSDQHVGVVIDDISSVSIQGRVKQKKWADMVSSLEIQALPTETMLESERQVDMPGKTTMETQCADRSRHTVSALNPMEKFYHRTFNAWSEGKLSHIEGSTAKSQTVENKAPELLAKLKTEVGEMIEKLLEHNNLDDEEWLAGAQKPSFVMTNLAIYFFPNDDLNQPAVRIDIRELSSYRTTGGIIRSFKLYFTFKNGREQILGPHGSAPKESFVEGLANPPN